MKHRKSHFRYTRDQRNGTFYLILLIIVCQLTYYFWSNRTEKEPLAIDVELFSRFQKEHDSLMNQRSVQKSSYRINPNYINDFRGYELGMSLREIDRLLEFRKSGAYINTEVDFQKITGVSDSLMKKLRPHLKFTNFSKKSKRKKRTVVSSIVKKDINKASKEDFQQVNGVGEVLSNRIVKYRDLLQGFSVKEQLQEVYNLKPEVVREIWNYFDIQSTPKIVLLNVNTASFKELLSVAYIDYELTKKILEYRDEVAEIQELSELLKIDGFPVDKFDRIALYLSAN